MMNRIWLTLSLLVLCSCQHQPEPAEYGANRQLLSFEKAEELLLNWSNEQPELLNRNFQIGATRLTEDFKRPGLLGKEPKLKPYSGIPSEDLIDVDLRTGRVVARYSIWIGHSLYANELQGTIEQSDSGFSISEPKLVSRRIMSVRPMDPAWSQTTR
ncbi:MAG: hypothetical protein AAF585_13110 [Verrucomicrobiota bacterium]